MKSRVKSQRLLALPALAIMLLILVGSSMYFKPAPHVPQKPHGPSWANMSHSSEEMVEKSDLILIGRIRRSEPEQQNQYIVTRQYIEIDRLLKGSVDKDALVPVAA